jgi:TonB family protein
MKACNFLLLFSLLCGPTLFAQDSKTPLRLDELDLVPVLNGCAPTDDDNLKRFSCLAEQLHNFIYDHVNYPSEAISFRSSNIVLANFIVEPDGTVSNVMVNAATFRTKQMTDSDSIMVKTSFEREVKAVLTKLPRFEPGLYQGEKRRVSISLMIRLELKDGVVFKPKFDLENTPLTPYWISGAMKFKDQGDIPRADSMIGVVETQPFFPGCLETNVDLKKKCAEQKMLEFLYGNLKYPKEARKKKCQGTVYIKFVVEKDGTLSNHEIVRDIGCGCGEEALRVIKMMPPWEPATQRGKPVKVQFNLPIRFMLE